MVSGVYPSSNIEPRPGLKLWSLSLAIETDFKCGPEKQRLEKKIKVDTKKEVYSWKLKYIVEDQQTQEPAPENEGWKVAPADTVREGKGFNVTEHLRCFILCASYLLSYLDTVLQDYKTGLPKLCSSEGYWDLEFEPRPCRPVLGPMPFLLSSVGMHWILLWKLFLGKFFELDTCWEAAIYRQKQLACSSIFFPLHC